MNITPLLKKALKNILRRSPATLELVMDITTDIILERTDARFDKIMAEEIADIDKYYAEQTGNELIAMILKP